MNLFRVILILSIVLSGCSSQQEPEAVAVKTASEPVLPALVKPAEVEPEDSSEGSAKETEENGEQPTLPVNSFEAPFPDRVDLFVSPKRQGRGIKKSSDGNENSVELLGFVYVQDQRVVLSIDGFVSPMAVGGQEAGIEVISIQPPVAVLQRGRQRWQVSLEN